MARPTSIRNRLVAALLVTVSALWGVGVFASYFDAHRELDQLFDAHLAQSAQLLSRQAGHELLEMDDLEDEELRSYAHTFAFQLWSSRGELLMRMGAAPMTRFSSVEEGFSDVSIEGQVWRVFSEWDTEHQVLVQMGERHDTRERLAARIALNGFAPLIVLLPMMGVLVWMIVNDGLRPLRRVGEEVAQREASSLASLEISDLPAEVKPLAERLNALFQRIARSLENEKRFTADAAHELRNPTAAIRAQAETALAAGDAQSLRSGLIHVLDSSQRLARLIDQLLALARLDTRTDALQIRDIDLVTLVRRTLAEIAPSAMERGATIDLEAPESALVCGDAVLLDVCIRNLVDNALAHGGAGVRITTRITECDSTWNVNVMDDGAGVRPEVLDRLGQRFFRAADASSPGSGLGLSIVERIVQLHHAAIRFESGHAGRGLSVTIAFPKAREGEGRRSATVPASHQFGVSRSTSEGEQ